MEGYKESIEESIRQNEKFVSHHKPHRPRNHCGAYAITKPNNKMN